jgi:hypothetical protein
MRKKTPITPGQKVAFIHKYLLEFIELRKDASGSGKPWLEERWRDFANVAREELGYSKGTIDQDILMKLLRFYEAGKFIESQQPKLSRLFNELRSINTDLKEHFQTLKQEYIGCNISALRRHLFASGFQLEPTEFEHFHVTKDWLFKHQDVEIGNTYALVTVDIFDAITSIDFIRK